MRRTPSTPVAAYPAIWRSATAYIIPSAHTAGSHGDADRFPALLRRFPRLKLADDVTDIQFKPTSLVYGARSLSVVW